MNKKRIFSVFLLIALAAVPVFASAPEAADEDILHKMTNLMFQIGFILFAAKLGGFLMKKVSMPSVLGELLIGIIIGPYLLGGIPFLGAFPTDCFPL